MQAAIRISGRTLWAIAGIVVLLSLAWLLATAATQQLVLIYGAIVLAEGFRPPIAWLRARRLPAAAAIAIVYATFIGVAALLAWLLIAPLTAQAAQLVDEAPRFAATAQATVEHYQQVFKSNPQVQTLIRNAPSQIGAFVMGKAAVLVQAPVAILGFVSNAFLLLLISICWLTASSDLAKFILSLIPEQRRDACRLMFDDMSLKLGGYVRGVGINMIVIGLLSGIGVRVLGVQFTFLLGVVAGLTEAIPIVGPLIGGGAAVIVALLTLGSAKAFQVALLYAVIQQVEGNTLVPLVMNRAVNLHPLAIVVALLIGSALLGIPGAILSVPTAALIQVAIMNLAVPRLRAEATDLAG